MTTEFLADKQTLEDLNVLGKYKTNSLFSLFNKVITAGGERLLEDHFRHPLTDHKLINSRSRVFRYFHQNALQLPFDEVAFAKAEPFILAGSNDHWSYYWYRSIRRGLMKQLGLNKEQEQFREGLKATLQVLQQMATFLQKIKDDPKNPLHAKTNEFFSLLQQYQLDGTKESINESLKTDIYFDHLLRGKIHLQLQSLLAFIYQLDMVIAVSDVARQKGFTYAKALEPAAAVLELRNCRHPALEKAIGNDLTLNEEKNLLFLTGANMAGKSTFMKSLGSAFYLAHMGFPVAVDHMLFSVKGGIYSSINVPDDLQQGISHFYAEVLRVKQVAASVCSHLPILVIFDELFKGTNVKDAYDATLAVTEAFGKYRRCNFIISTHIIEVGEVLINETDNIQFAFLPTVMQGKIPRYTYRMQEGITEDRHGMMIIRNEGILEML